MNSVPFRSTDHEITPTEAAAALARGAITLIDVREPYEWDVGHAPGSVHIPLDRLAEQADTLPPNGLLAFICLSGVRSAMAVSAFRAAGYDAFNVSGGFRAWLQAGCPVEPEGAVAAPHGRPAV
jgi:rhodanese-related sulfurtransferase